MAVEGEAGFGLCSDAPRPVMTRGEFEIDTPQLEVSGLILDAHIRQWDLPVHNDESMPLCEAFHFLRIFSSVTKLRAVPIQIAFQFVVENDAKGLAASLLNALGFRVKEPVEFRIMLGFPRLPLEGFGDCSLLM